MSIGEGELRFVGVEVCGNYRAVYGRCMKVEGSNNPGALRRLGVRISTRAIGGAWESRRAESRSAGVVAQESQRVGVWDLQRVGAAEQGSCGVWLSLARIACELLPSNPAGL